MINDAHKNMDPIANIFVRENCRKNSTRSRGIEQQKHKVEEEPAAVANPPNTEETNTSKYIRSFQFPHSLFYFGEKKWMKKRRRKISGAGSGSEE